MEKFRRLLGQASIFYVALGLIAALPAFAGIGHWTQTGDSTACNSGFTELVCAEWTFGPDPESGYTTTCCVDPAAIGGSDLSECQYYPDGTPAIPEESRDEIG